MTNPNPLHILVVDDEPLITSLLQGELELEGYAVSTSNDGASGLVAIRSTPAPELIVLDWNLPDFSGLEICRRVRATGLAIPILMLTAHDAIKDKVEALDAGADDYLIKPFSIEELLARLRALHRRTMPAGADANGSPDHLDLGDLSINLANHGVERAGQAIQLSNKEYQLLLFLMQSPNKVHSRTDILHGVWGDDYFGDDNLLDVYIRYLRQKIEAPHLPKLIHTVRGVGFMIRQDD
jgi:DNA-binding response OmpR family regulator